MTEIQPKKAVHSYALASLALSCETFYNENGSAHLSKNSRSPTLAIRVRPWQFDDVLRGVAERDPRGFRPGNIIGSKNVDPTTPRVPRYTKRVSHNFAQNHGINHTRGGPNGCAGRTYFVLRARPAVACNAMLRMVAGSTWLCTSRISGSGRSHSTIRAVLISGSVFRRKPRQRRRLEPIRLFPLTQQYPWNVRCASNYASPSPEMATGGISLRPQIAKCSRERTKIGPEAPSKAASSIRSVGVMEVKYKCFTPA